MKEIKAKEQKYIHRGFFDLRIDTLQKNNGQTSEYTILLSKADAVAILVQTEEGKYLLLEEYRHPINKTILGTPGGRIEADETPTDAAQRELLEETGYHSKKMHYLGTYYPLPAICDQKVYLFFAPQAKKVIKRKLDAFEAIDLVFYDEKDLLSKIQEEEAVDGIVGNLLLYTHLLAQEKK